MNPMEIAIRDRRTRPQKWTTLLAMISAAALLVAAMQLLAPANAAAMADEDGAGSPDCQLMFDWFLEACEEGEDGAGGDGSSGDDSSGDDSSSSDDSSSDEDYDADDVCQELGYCDYPGEPDSGGGGSGGGGSDPWGDDPHGDICERFGGCDDSSSSDDGSYDADDVCAEFGHCGSQGKPDSGGGGSSGDPHGDVCARYGACDPPKGSGSEPKGGWDASDEEEAKAAEEALDKAGEKPPKVPARWWQEPKKELCLDRYIAWQQAIDTPGEDAALQSLLECRTEHAKDPTITARASHPKKGQRKRGARRSGKRGSRHAITRRG
jgi:hypothetical protein